jgi:hypothetical protein
VGRWLKRLAILGAIGGLAGLVIQRRHGDRFDPAQPAHDWGTTSLTIDEA